MDDIVSHNTATCRDCKGKFGTVARYRDHLVCRVYVDKLEVELATLRTQLAAKERVPCPRSKGLLAGDNPMNQPTDLAAVRAAAEQIVCEGLDAWYQEAIDVAEYALATIPADAHLPIDADWLRENYATDKP